MSIRKQVKSFPKYQIHKASGRAFVWWQGKRHYLGTAGSAESYEAYHRFVAEIARNNGAIIPQMTERTSKNNAAEITVNDVMAAYLTNKRDVISGKEFENTIYSFKPLRKFHGHTLAEQFGPKALKLVRQAMIDHGLARKVINQRIGRIKRLFKFAVAEEMVSPTVYQALLAVEGLRAGHTEARETEPIQPISNEQIELLMPFLSSVNAAMIKLQRLTGMRPGEVCRMRTVDIDRSGEVWFYRPSSHKNKWRGRDRVIPLGPQSQELLLPFLDRDVESYLFTPHESYLWLRQNSYPGRKERKTPVYPCELRRRAKRQARRKVSRFRSRFTTNSYDRAIKNAIQRAGKGGVAVESWSPNQLRHTRATELRKEYGLEAAQVILGHAKADVTQIYAERDLPKPLKSRRCPAKIVTSGYAFVVTFCLWRANLDQVE